MNSKIIVPIFTFLILLSFTHADFSVDINPIVNDIFEDDAGLYELVITNNDSFEQSFERPSTYQVDWITYTSPGAIIVPPNSVRKFNLTLDPKTTVIPGQHEVLLSVRSVVTKEYVDKSLFIYVRSINQLFPGYKASIALSVDAPYEIDPREEFPISIYLRNRNALNVENMTIRLSSKLINKEINTPFLPLEEKTETLRFSIDKYQLPIEDTLEVSILIKNFTVNKRSIPLKIKGYTELKEDVVVKKSLLKTTKEITLTNEGNIVNNDGYLIPVGGFQNLFTSTTPESETIQGENQKYKSLELSFEPLESKVITAQTNYRGILYTLIIIVLSVVLYYKYRSPIILKKRIIPIHTENEGVTEFHIRLLVMNRTKQAVENIGVTEIIPKIVSVIREQSIGTLEPSKVIKHEKKGTLLKWEINYLEPYEERIITYKIMSKLGIVGSLVLPKTKAKYETSKGVSRVTHSGKESLKI